MKVDCVYSDGEAKEYPLHDDEGYLIGTRWAGKCKLFRDPVILATKVDKGPLKHTRGFWIGQCSKECRSYCNAQQFAKEKAEAEKRYSMRLRKIADLEKAIESAYKTIPHTEKATPYVRTATRCVQEILDSGLKSGWDYKTILLNLEDNPPSETCIKFLRDWWKSTIKPAVLREAEKLKQAELPSLNCIMLSSRNAVVNRALAWKACNATVAHNLTVGALPPEEFEKGRDVYLQAECGNGFYGWAINKTYPHGTFVKSGFKTADAAAAWAKQNGYFVRFVAQILIKSDIPKVNDYEAACRKYGVKRV